MAVPHYTYLVLKMPGPRGIIIVKGNFELSDICDKEFHKMAQTFGMIAEYGQLKGKNRHGDRSGYKATQRKQSRQHRAISEETSSPSGGPGQICGKEIRDSRHLYDDSLGESRK
jgi:hypothetical protein